MACYHPSAVNVDRKAPGGRRIPDTVTVPCGSCLGCRADQAREWAIRLVHEGDALNHSWFVTLTYDEEHLPENGSLHPPHVSEFARALRKRSKGRISYYICGEYGETTARPHYHAVLSGARLLDRDVLDHRASGPVWRSDTLAAAWPHGLHEFTAVTMASASYVAGYVRKKLKTRPWDEYNPYDRVDPATGEIHRIEKEFARMSRRPGIGRAWIERYWQDVYPRDFVVVEGREYKPPRYYDKWMDQHQPGIMEEVRDQRWQDAIRYGDEKLIMKEKIHRAKVALFQSRSQV